MDVVPSGSISAHESQVLEALRDHQTNAEIARRLYISVRTVESHVSSLLRKLGASDRRDLATLAAATGPRPLGGLEGLADVRSPWTTFVGRSAELTELSDALSTNRLVTLLGAGGVGKTRLATVAAGRLASEFSAGGAFVDLVPVRAEFVVEAVAAALGVVERAQEPLEQSVLHRLGAGDILLVLDNCEHVLAAVGAFTERALISCPRLTILATSREPLGVIGERLVPLGPLALTAAHGTEGSEAEHLFVDRAGDAGRLASQWSQLSELCRRLEGMPLAIELAAARAHSLGLDGLLVGLDDHLRLLRRTGGHDNRHSSMRCVIDWSHRLLAEDERTLFRRLGVFAGGFDLVAAATVGGGGDLSRTSDVIGRLADKSLLVRVQHGPSSRWRMLDTVRAYAREQLEHSEDEPDVRGRYLSWATSTAGEIEGWLGERQHWQDPFDAVCDDLRAALEAADAGATGGSDFALAMSLGRLSYARRFLIEARDHLRGAAFRAPDEQSALEALQTAAAAAFAEMRGQEAFDLLQAAFARASAGGDSRSAAIALAQAAAIAGRCPALFARPVTHERLIELVHQAEALAPPGDLEASAYVALAAAWDGARGLSVADRRGAERALTLARQLDDPVLISSALDANASAVSADGHHKEAWEFTRQRLPLLDRLARHDPRSGGEVADIFHMASEGTLGAGEIQAALRAAEDQYHDNSSLGLAHFAANHFVIPLTLQGKFDEALAQADVMRQAWQRAGSPVAGWMAPSFFATALIHGLRADPDRYNEFLDLAMAVRMQAAVNSFSFFVVPRVALHLGDVGRAQATVATDDQSLCGPYTPYAEAFRVEVAVVAGAPDAATRLAASQPLAGENKFAGAYLLRAAARLYGDEGLLKQALVEWESLGARFERACTLMLLPGHMLEGTAELAALGCPPPVV